MPAKPQSSSGIALLVTVGRAHQAALISIETHRPERIVFLTTIECQTNVGKILSALGRTVRNQTHLTVHNNVQQCYADALAAIEDLCQTHAIVYADLTSGSTPMSLGVWQACLRSGAIAHWIDNTDMGPLTLRLSPIETDGPPGRFKED